MWDVTLEKYCKLQPKPKTADELKVALQTIWEQLPQLHTNNAMANFTTCLTTYKAVSASRGHSSICSNSVHLQVCILISSPTNWPSADLLRTMFGILRNGVVLVLSLWGIFRQHLNCIFKWLYINTIMAYQACKCSFALSNICRLGKTLVYFQSF